MSATPWVRLAGGLALVALGVRGMPAPARVPEERAGTALGAEYASALGLMLANPQTIITFAAVFAASGLTVAGGGWAAPAVTTAGVACGSLVWWLVLVTAVGAIRERMGERSLLWVNSVSGAAIAVLGVVAAWAGIVALAG